MKKKILKIALVTIVTICTTIGVKSAHKENESPLSLIFANVEALASSSEGGATGGHSLECGKGTIKLCKAKCGRCQVELEVWGTGSPVILHCPLDR